MSRSSCKRINNNQTLEKSRRPVQRANAWTTTKHLKGPDDQFSVQTREQLPSTWKVPMTSSACKRIKYNEAPEKSRNSSARKRINNNQPPEKSPLPDQCANAPTTMKHLKDPDDQASVHTRIQPPSTWRVSITRSAFERVDSNQAPKRSRWPSQRAKRANNYKAPEGSRLPGECKSANNNQAPGKVSMLASVPKYQLNN